ncbi:IS3 family transposase [Neobacillus sp. PS3-12]|uniref:IS3 family transposase n=1 Tax=Neobacillus sp. PS3-12 TaxID=3070677 RepID=UPI0027DEE8E8|nr:IS3 family transposase [Neobacillus sp. PS3-12]WML55160.1 IS3 family transposase [Neobacillus sp. PS3-12]
MRKEYSVRLLCSVLGVSTSGYYAYIKRPNVQVSVEDRELLTKIKKAYSLHKGTYGAKRIAKYLSAKGTLVNHKKVARIMKEANLKATVRRPKTTKESKGKAAGYVYENLLNRDFHATYPNQKWVTDMTEVWVEDKKFYVSALMDLFNRELLALQVSSSPNKELIKATIETTQKRRKLKSLEGVIIHSDQGSVYRSFDHNKLAKTLKFTPSMSRKANCWDNAVIESFFSHFKTEFPCFFEVKLCSFMQNIKGFVHYYNEKRIQQKLGFVSPKDYYKNYQKLS